MKLQLIALMAVAVPLGAYAQDVAAPVASQSSFGMHDQMNGGAPGAMPMHHRPMGAGGPGMEHGVSGSMPMHHGHPPHGVSGTMGGMGGHDMPPPPPPRDRPNGAMPPPPPPQDRPNGDVPSVGGMQGQ